jgi:hypothetical protein
MKSMILRCFTHLVPCQHYFCDETFLTTFEGAFEFVFLVVFHVQPKTFFVQVLLAADLQLSDFH